jgi:clan AA aspartic protease (TIGR02281 family)
MFASCRILGIAVPGILLVAVTAAADEKGPEETLKAKGLRRTGAAFVLPAEAEVAKRLRDADALKKKLAAAQREIGFWQQKVEEKQNLKLLALRRRSDLSAQLPLARTVDAHNRIVAAINELNDRAALLEQSKNEESSLKAAQGAASQVGEDFVEHLLQARKLCERIDADYKALQADAQVSQAIEEYNQATGKTYKLGPSPSLAANEKRLQKFEETVLSDSIELRQGRNRLWQVSVALNGQAPVDMAIDTGASVVVLPWKMAQAVGLAPKPQDPKINLQTADGTIIEGRRVVAETVRVGRFTADKVECAVLPETMPGAAPLLGLSFFKHFAYKIDTANSKLIMSQVEADQDAAGGRSRKKPARPGR